MEKYIELFANVYVRFSMQTPEKHFVNVPHLKLFWEAGKAKKKTWKIADKMIKYKGSIHGLSLCVCSDPSFKCAFIGFSNHLVH